MSTFEINCVSAEGFEMEYCRFGEGDKTFVIIPGVSLQSVMPNAMAVSASFKEYTNDYTMYMFDRKKDITSEYSVWDMARDTATAMKSIGIQDADIFGASQGGMIAQCIAIEHPELVHSLYLGSTLSKQNEISIEVFDKWMELSKGDDVQQLNKYMNKKVYSNEYYEKYKDVFVKLEQVGDKQDLDRFYYLSKACRDFDCYDRLDEIKCKVYVVSSKEDNVLGCIGGQQIAEKLKCPIELYEGFSHAVYDEAPDYRQNMFSRLGEMV